MDSEKDPSVLLERIESYQNKEHEKNRKRIRNGFLSMLIVPLIILVLMFTSDLTGTSKLILLVVWIISMILIAAYLITVDYVDHKLMHMLEIEPAGAGKEDEAIEDAGIEDAGNEDAGNETAVNGTAADKNSENGQDDRI